MFARHSGETGTSVRIGRGLQRTPARIVRR
jgi:hypothetical protein